MFLIKSYDCPIVNCKIKEQQYVASVWAPCHQHFFLPGSEICLFFLFTCMDIVFMRDYSCFSGKLSIYHGCGKKACKTIYVLMGWTSRNTLCLDRSNFKSRNSILRSRSVIMGPIKVQIWQYRETMNTGNDVRAETQSSVGFLLSISWSPHFTNWTSDRCLLAYSQSCRHSGCVLLLLEGKNQ